MDNGKLVPKKILVT